MIQVADSKQKLDFRVEFERHIEAPIDVVFDSLVAELGPESTSPEGTPLRMEIELFPGGRWYRDLGENNGHLWGHVQALKRPSLLEITGPLFMSRAVTNNVQYRLEEEAGKTTLRLVHEAFGMIPEEALEGMPDGWTAQLDRIEHRIDRNQEDN